MWPLTVAEGEISCERKELMPNSGPRRIPLVMFTSNDGVFGINGAAKRLWGYTPIEELVRPKQRDTEATLKILNSWLKAGLALCDGDVARAQLALKTDMNGTGTPLLSRNIAQDEEFKAILTTERRIYKEAVACWDTAVKQSFVWFDAQEAQFDRLMNSGRRNEAAKLSQLRLEKEDSLNLACRDKLRQEEGLTKNQLQEIEWKGFRQKWPDK